MSETMEEIKKSGYTGNLRGEYFDGVWADEEESPMIGYAIYSCYDGEIYPYGRFSETGNSEDSVDCGDLCMAGNEKTFERIP
jgi:hypothetical protein